MAVKSSSISLRELSRSCIICWLSLIMSCLWRSSLLETIWHNTWYLGKRWTSQEASTHFCKCRRAQLTSLLTGKRESKQELEEHPAENRWWKLTFPKIKSIWGKSSSSPKRNYSVSSSDGIWYHSAYEQRLNPRWVLPHTSKSRLSVEMPYCSSVCSRENSQTTWSARVSRIS